MIKAPPRPSTSFNPVRRTGAPRCGGVSELWRRRSQSSIDAWSLVECQ